MFGRTTSWKALNTEYASHIQECRRPRVCALRYCVNLTNHMVKIILFFTWCFFCYSSETPKTTHLGHLFLLAKWGSDCENKGWWALMVANCICTLNHTFFHSKWNHKLQNKHCAVLIDYKLTSEKIWLLGTFLLRSYIECDEAFFFLNNQSSVALLVRRKCKFRHYIKLNLILYAIFRSIGVKKWLWLEQCKQ